MISNATSSIDPQPTLHWFLSLPVSSKDGAATALMRADTESESESGLVDFHNSTPVVEIPITHFSVSLTINTTTIRTDD